MNQGDNAGTTGAIYGQLAGSYYGVESMPGEWPEKLTVLAEMTSLADQHRQGAVQPTTSTRRPG